MCHEHPSNVDAGNASVAFVPITSDQESLMNVHTIFRHSVAAAAVAFATTGVALAQSQTGVDTAPAASVPSQTTTTQAPSDLNAPIGSTSLTRADSSNEAFQKLDKQNRGFLSMADVAQLPSFGDAFANADRDADGRLDRSEFADAWAYYVDRNASTGVIGGAIANGAPQ